MVAGGGVHLSDAVRELVRLQEDCRVAGGNNDMGKGAVSESHPLSLGVIGYFMGTGGMAKFQRALVAEGRCDPVRRQPHQPERHRLLDAISAQRHATSISTSTDWRSAATTRLLRLVGDAKLDAGRH